MFFTFLGMISLASNSKLCKFITSLKLIKPPQNFVQGSFFIKLVKICFKGRGEILASGALLVCKIFRLTPGVKVWSFLRISCLIKFSHYLNVKQEVVTNKEASRNTILQNNAI